ncbi:hypothetical protein BCR39DRAFT_532155 [Naematelia encephala]|uniref:Transmembrane protein n=1 Tax=Naematelia encephala TaxID=71784 RepID=A0A1Y2B638_9TREE|nr:hypothetical protein BCR39DRAFT_532155 [Naematelia encephala]
MMGTIYGWPRGKGISTHNRLTGTNRAITGIVAALAFVACLGCIMFFVFHSLKLRKERARRRRVVVAAVFLDAQDRILVNSTDGLLPMCDIASLSGATDNSSSHRSVRSVTQSFNSDATVLGMDLTTGHDAFVSALRMSWSWRQPSLSQINNGVTPSDSADQPGAPTLASIIADIRRESSSTVESGAAGGSKQMRLSVTKFLERFALSSGQLAARLIGTQNGISRLGVLYDQILTTGWVKLNNSNDTVSKGQLIFLVRRIASAAERDDLAAKNFIFADSASVAASLHKTLSVPLEHIVPLLEDVRTWCDGTVRNELKPGVLYTGVAVVQATPFDGLRILLERDQRARLPMRELCTFGAPAGGDELSGTIEEIGEAITWLDGMTLLSVIARNMTVESDPVGGPRVAQLLAAIERALIPMLDEMLTAEDMAHILPRLTLHPMIVPLLPGSQGPHIIVFYANYDAAVNTFTDKWLPFSLFRAQNACVMAPYIQAALRAEPLLSPIPTARRPSKVQFEFPVVQSQVQGQGGDGTFGSYAFPPRTDSIIPATNSGSGSHRCQSVPRRSSLARTRFGSIDKFADPDPQSPMASGFTTMQHSPERDKAVGLAGVADWEAEWLLMLLRNKLHAEA